MVGPINLFGNGGNAAGLLLLGAAAIAAGMAFKDREADAIWPAAAACGVLLYVFARLQYAMGQMRASLRELEGNPFAGLAETAMGSVQLQWGWIVLAAGAGLMIYGSFKSRGGLSSPLRFTDRLARTVAIASVLGVLALPAYDLVRTLAPASSSADPLSVAEAAADAAAVSAGADASTIATPTREEASYISEHLEVYELQAKYYNTYGDGRVPGVTFKVKNNGPKTLNRVTVRVVFYDSDGQAIAEEEYSPVLVSEYSFGESNTPLRPNYISQQERGRFWTAKSVPSEWETGRATATVTEIEFAPEE